MSSAEKEVHDDESEELLRWLKSPSAYPHRPQQVECVQTHISWVFLAGDLVFKLKKQVHFDFLDFTTLAQREQACRDEVRLNSRLAPGIYLGVKAIVRNADGSFKWCEDERAIDPIVDWAVCMRRLPLDRTLDSLLAAEALLPEHIDQLAEHLLDFYAKQKPLPVTVAEYHQRFYDHIGANTEALLASQHHLPLAMVRRVQGWQMQVLELMPTLLEARVTAGKIYDGHGDLRPEHICFADPLAIFDCIEFNSDFRQVDVLDELAFLAAECDYLGAGWVGRQLLQRFQDRTGDHPPAMLVDFYKAYRATVRAKVAALRADQLQGDAKLAAARESLAHLECADRSTATRLQPMVLIVGGLSGSGKTTLARELAQRFVAELIRSDVVRQELFQAEHAMADPTNRYSAAARERVYTAMLGQAKQHHGEEVSVVLDATFASHAILRQAASIATNPRVRFWRLNAIAVPK